MKEVIHMADSQVFAVVNRNHQRRCIMDALDSDLEIFILKANLDAISARRRRDRYVPKMSLLRRKS